jgi:ribose/xylose/arabinose/galactoside ABC-type transport system permease subunit
MRGTKLVRTTLDNSNILLFLVIFGVFGILAPRFLTLASFQGIVTNSSYIGIVVVGMTFVLLTGGIDLSVGANMYLAGVVVSILTVNLHLPIWVALLACILEGVLFGLINALAIVKLGILPFIVTLSTMVAGRGIAQQFTQSQSITFPSSVTMMASTKLFGLISMPIVIFLLVVLLGHLFLTRTPGGRQVYAVGFNVESARKAGINPNRIVFMTYVVSGACAALGAFVSIAQIGEMNARYGTGEEFNAIAAAVLGGVSLFGGVGTVFPGVVLGTVMLQMIQAGLVFTGVDLYIQPIIKAAIIYVALLFDSFRIGLLEKLNRRNIMARE